MESVSSSKCYLCSSTNVLKKSGKVRDNDSIAILECMQCGLVFLSSVEHISEQFYADSGMHSENVNIISWLKETAIDDERRVNYLRRTIENKSVLDFGCGNGGFLLKSREYARNVAGIELETINASFFNKSDLNVHTTIDSIEMTFDVITLFHVLEHLKDPRVVLELLVAKLSPGGRIIIEVPNANDALLSLYENKAFSHFTYWSCHLYLFTNETLCKLCRQAGFHIEYVKQIQRYPLSNHLHWLSRGKPGGHEMWSFIDSGDLSKQYEMQLSSIGMCDTIIASIYNKA